MTDQKNASNDNLNDLPEIVTRIVDTMRKGRIDQLVITKGDFHLELSASEYAFGRPPVYAGEPQVADGDADSESLDDSFHVITSPMIGTFYAAPAPGEPAFVKPGDTVSPGDTIGIVEAMKIMNEISADRAGTVEELIAEDGETVEFGSPLLRLLIKS